jgi:hypothetical protein
MTTPGGKDPKNFGRWGSLKDRRQSSQASLANVQQTRGNIRHSTDADSAIYGVQSHSSEGGFVHPGRECAEERGQSEIRLQDRFHSGGVLRRAAHQDCFQEVDQGVRTELGERRPRTELPQVNENCFGRNKK